MIAIVDYDAGNLKSVEKALTYLGEESVVTRSSSIIEKAQKVILPGVGSFGMAMENLKKYDLDKILKEVVLSNKPLMGICLGLQLLFSGSEESQGIEGLKILEGDIVKIPAKDDLKIPHVGWNSLSLQNDGKLFKNFTQNPYVYFVHSYYLKAKNESIVKATTNYGTCIHASVEQGNVFACQFHPEKSSSIGLQILKNFAEL